MDGEMERVLPDDADDGAERRWIDDTLNRLSRSSFRAKFELSAKDRSMPPPRAAAGASPNGTIFPKAGSSPMPKSIAWRTWSWRG